MTKKISSSDGWADILQLSNGTSDDKIKALRLVFSSPKSYGHEDVRQLVKRLEKPTEPEAVRVELARGLASTEITMGTMQELLGMLEDPSEAVREEARVSRARGQLELERSRGELVSRVRVIRPKWWWIRKARRWLASQKLWIALVASFVLGGTVASLAYDLPIPLSASSLTSLSQVDATIFALAFTIPLATSQLTRYPSSPESFLDKQNMLYFAGYGAATYLGLIAPVNSPIADVTLGLSVACTALLAPYLFRAGLKLKPAHIVKEERDRVLGKWKQDTEEGLSETGSQLESIARISLERRDYETFDNAVDAMISLLQASMALPARSKYFPLQVGAEGLNQAVRRIGEGTMEDPLALTIWCYRLLDLATHKKLTLDEETNILKHIELQHLRDLGSRVISQMNNSQSLPVLLITIIEWGVFNVPSKAVGMKEPDQIDWAAGALLRFPEKAVDNAFRVSFARVSDVFFPSAIYGYIYPYRLSYDSRMKRHLDQMLPKLESEYNRFVLEQKIAKLPSGTTTTTVSTAIDSAGADDALQLAMLQRVAYSEEALARKDWQIPPIMESSEALSSQLSGSIVLKATLDSIIIGSVRGKSDGTTCLVSRLFVHPKFQHQGIGSRLLAEVEKRFSGTTFRGYAGFSDPEKMRFLVHRGYVAKDSYTLSNGIELSYTEKISSSPVMTNP